jgi:hypothetical protein
VAQASLADRVALRRAGGDCLVIRSVLLLGRINAIFGECGGLAFDAQRGAKANLVKQTGATCILARRYKPTGAGSLPFRDHAARMGSY